MASSIKRGTSLPSSPMYASRMQEKLQQNTRNILDLNPKEREDEIIAALSFAMSMPNEFEGGNIDDLLARGGDLPFPLYPPEQPPALLKRIQEKENKKKTTKQRPQFTFHPTIDAKSAQICNNTYNNSFNDSSNNTQNSSNLITTDDITNSNIEQTDIDGNNGKNDGGHNSGDFNNSDNHTGNREDDNTNKGNDNNNPVDDIRGENRANSSNDNNSDDNNHNRENNNYGTSPRTPTSGVHGRDSVNSVYSINNNGEMIRKPRGHLLYEMDKERAKHIQEMKKESEEKELSHCTFAPQILNSPVPYSVTNREVVGRLQGWHQDKMEKIEKLRVETQFFKEEQALEPCTFKPKLSPLAKSDGVEVKGADSHLDRQVKGREQKELAKSAEFSRHRVTDWSPKQTEPQEFNFMIRHKIKAAAEEPRALHHTHSRTRTPTPTQQQQRPMKIKDAPRSRSFSAYSTPRLASDNEQKPYATKYAGGLISVADVEKIRNLLGAYTTIEEEEPTAPPTVSNTADTTQTNTRAHTSTSNNSSPDHEKNNENNNDNQHINSNTESAVQKLKNQQNIRPSSAPPKFENEPMMKIPHSPKNRTVRGGLIARPYHSATALNPAASS